MAFNVLEFLLHPSALYIRHDLEGYVLRIGRGDDRFDKNNNVSFETLHIILGQRLKTSR